MFSLIIFFYLFRSIWVFCIRIPQSHHYLISEVWGLGHRKCMCYGYLRISMRLLWQK
uniref:Uncharacterized protein n=1 Tax=Lepeophtheirus salmonis TaxID=72036 RepID=A0A0K2TF92_LEPSM